MDCGNGVLANLSQVIEPGTLDAVFVTHEHPDHWADLYALQALLRYAPDGPAGRLALHMPPGLFERVMAPLSERGREEFAEAEAYAGAAPHMTASQAGSLAYSAGALQLVLTHLWPTVDREEAVAAASAAYGCLVHVANELDTFDIGAQ